jgi:hypothetical protein
MTILAQIIIHIDQDGVFRCEMPGANGARRRIDLKGRDGMWEAMIRAELLEASILGRANRAENEAVRKQNIRQSQADHTERMRKQLWVEVAHNHGSGFATKHIPGGAPKRVPKAPGRVIDI